MSRTARNLPARSGYGADWQASQPGVPDNRPGPRHRNSGQDSAGGRSSLLPRNAAPAAELSPPLACAPREIALQRLCASKDYRSLAVHPIWTRLNRAGALAFT